MNFIIIAIMVLAAFGLAYAGFRSIQREENEKAEARHLASKVVELPRIRPYRGTPFYDQATEDNNKEGK